MLDEVQGPACGAEKVFANGVDGTIRAVGASAKSKYHIMEKAIWPSRAASVDQSDVHDQVSSGRKEGPRVDLATQRSAG